jgi:threonyl-tRNA synthetase
MHVKDEILTIWQIVDTFYSAVGFGKLKVRLSLHDPKAPEKYLGTPEMWQRAEGALRHLAIERNADFFESPGEAAFYGPKVDFMTKDSIGREWQVATIQLDINMPERFDLSCVNEEGKDERIVMIHAAIMGSLERFLSIYIEHTAGLFPLWLAPTQVALIPVAETHVAFARDLEKTLLSHGIRVQFYGHEESLGKRIREGEKQKIPYLLVMGDKEIADSAVTVRSVKTKNQVVVPIAEFVEKTVSDIKTRKLESSIG